MNKLKFLKQDIKGAIADFDKAIQLNPNNPELYLNRGYIKQLINENCRVSEHEYRVCMLIKLGIPLSCIAEITNKSRRAISLTRRRLYERAFGKEKNAAECWDKFILSL